MNEPTTPSLAINWEKPTYLLALFCLCPLLAASNSLALAIALSILTLIATGATLILMTVARLLITDPLRVFASLMISITVMTMVELAIHAWDYDLYRALGIFLPLMVIACLLLCRTEMPNTSSFRFAAFRWIKMNAGFSFAALVLGAGRELVGHGSLFYDASPLLGLSSHLHFSFFREDMGFLLAVLAPGAFIGFGIGVALYNWCWLHFARKTRDH